jgi:HPt (histidine-containing phosphotransfer) domain-containing protein
LTNHHQEEIKKIISLFLSESQNLMTQIKENHELKNIEALHTAVHTLKGISHNVGADKLFSYIKETGLEIKDQSFLNNKAWVQNLEIIYQNTKKKVEEALR